MARQRERGRNSFLSFIVLLIVIYLIGLPVLLATRGSAADLIGDMADLIPFGSFVLQISVKLLSKFVQVNPSYLSILPLFTFANFLEELAKGLFTVILFEALNLLGGLMLGVWNPEGRWNRMKKLALSVLNALLAAAFAPWLIRVVLDNIKQAGGLMTAVVSGVLALVLLGGGAAFFAAMLGISASMALLYVIIKFGLIACIELFLVYFFIYSVLLVWETGAYWALLTGSGSLFVCLLLLAGIGLMIDSVFGAND